MTHLTNSECKWTGCCRALKASSARNCFGVMNHSQTLAYSSFAHGVLNRHTTLLCKFRRRNSRLQRNFRTMASSTGGNVKNDFLVGGVKIEGESIGGMSTSIVLPQYKAVFDIGRCPQRSCYQQTVFITHGHLDHIGGLHFHASTRDMLRVTPSRFVVPDGLKEPAEKMLEIAKELGGHPFAYEVITLKVGEEFILRNGCVVRPFPTIHPVHSQGYVLYSRRQKLKPEYLGLPGKEIGALKRSGVDISTTIEMPEVAFTGDTCVDFLDLATTRDALRAKLLITEMTFIDDKTTRESAKELGHMHVADFIEHQDRFENEAILLTHFSPRYSSGEIIDKLNDQLPESLKSKCTPFVEGFP